MKFAVRCLLSGLSTSQYLDLSVSGTVKSRSRGSAEYIATKLFRAL